MSAGAAAATIIFAIAGWLAIGLLTEVRKRAGERLAAWLLPESQTCTFRIALAILKTAELIAPNRRVVYRRPEPMDLWSISWAQTGAVWWAADAALRELEEDLAAEERVFDPVRLVWPLMAEAVAARFANWAQRAKGIFFGACRRSFGIMIVGVAGALDMVFWLNDQVRRTAE